MAVVVNNSLSPSFIAYHSLYFSLIIEIEDDSFLSFAQEFNCNTNNNNNNNNNNNIDTTWFQTRGNRIPSTITISQLKMANNFTSDYNQLTKQDSIVKNIDEVNFFSGSQGVEKVRGILHLFRDKLDSSCTDKSIVNSTSINTLPPTGLVCLLAIPVSISCTQLITFLATVNHVLKKIWIIRNSSPNQYMSILDFGSPSEAVKFRDSFHNKHFSSLDPGTCHIALLSRIQIIKSSEDSYPPANNLTELPVCTVCLEKLDETCNGILTILCNHSFHSDCLTKWDDNICPVCRATQTPELSEDNQCSECQAKEDLWLCMICGTVSCGRYLSGHGVGHFRVTGHTYAMHLGTQRVWDYVGDNYVHRLVLNKDDGKLVEINRSSIGVAGDEKVESLALEYTYLLTQQLDSQRAYFEQQLANLTSETKTQIKACDERANQLSDECQELMNRFENCEKEKKQVEKKYTQLTTKANKMDKELKEEQQMNSCLQNNQIILQQKVKEAEELNSKTLHIKEEEIRELRDQVRDVMLSMEMTSKLEKALLKEETKDSQLIIQPGATASNNSSNSKKHRKKN